MVMVGGFNGDSGAYIMKLWVTTVEPPCLYTCATVSTDVAVLTTTVTHQQVTCAIHTGRVAVWKKVRNAK